MNIDSMLISEEMTILQALEILDRTAKKILFVTKGKTLLAAITDGDIRRWILSKGSLDAKVKEVANYNPKFLTWKQRKEANSFMQKKSIVAVPIVNEKHEIVTIAFENEKIGCASCRERV